MVVETAMKIASGTYGHVGNLGTHGNLTNHANITIYANISIYANNMPTYPWMPSPRRKGFHPEV
jgi:hypothetical protein